MERQEEHKKYRKAEELWFIQHEKENVERQFVCCIHLLLFVRENRVPEYCSSCKVQSLQTMEIDSCHNGNCIYEFIVRTVKHWKKFSKEVGESQFLEVLKTQQ